PARRRDDQSDRPQRAPARRVLLQRRHRGGARHRLPRPPVHHRRRAHRHDGAGAERSGGRGHGLSLPQGVRAFADGFAAARAPGIARYVWLPALVSLVVIVGGLAFAFGYLESLSAWLTG